MSKLKRASEWVELCANIASILVFAVVIGLFARRHLTHRLGLDRIANESLRPGVGLSLPGIRWADAHSTVIFALSVRCPYCASSTGFYRKLLDLNVDKRFRPVAVFPQGEKYGKAYLESHGLLISDVIQADFASLGVLETPTLVAVNEAGGVSFLWAGKLSAQAEKDVISHLELDEAHKLPLAQPHTSDIAKDASRLMTARDLAAYNRARRGIPPIVDIRSRDYYASGHIANAINIPFDELDSRASHELPKSRMILVYCHYRASCETQRYQEGVQTYCSLGDRALRHLGFTHTRFISDDLYTLKGVGVKVSTAPELDFVASLPR